MSKKNHPPLMLKEELQDTTNEVAKTPDLEKNSEPIKESFMSKPLSTKNFVLSLIIIVVVSLTGTYFFHQYLYGDSLNLKDLKNYNPVSRKPISFNVEVTNPEDELLTFDKTTIVSGRTISKAVVLISNNGNDYATVANDNGEFSKVINLDKGSNDITVNVFDSFGNSKTINRSIYYSEEQI